MCAFYPSNILKQILTCLRAHLVLSNHLIQVPWPQVQNNFRTAITVPEKSFKRFRDILNQMIEKTSALEVNCHSLLLTPFLSLLLLLTLFAYPFLSLSLRDSYDIYSSVD